MLNDVVEAGGGSVEPAKLILRKSAAFDGPIANFC
jgi:hypothetical protein